jgi:hypothetical protein
MPTVWPLPVPLHPPGTSPCRNGARKRQPNVYMTRLTPRPFPLHPLEDLRPEWPIFRRKHANTSHARDSQANGTKNVKLRGAEGGQPPPAHLAFDPRPPTRPGVTASVENPCRHRLVATRRINDTGEDQGRAKMWYPSSPPPARITNPRWPNRHPHHLTPTSRRPVMHPQCREQQ